MTMVCQQCNATYEQRLQCPLCGSRLLFHDARRLGERSAARPLRWQQQPWGRILIGLLLAQGLFYGLRQLLTGILMAAQGREEVEQLTATATGFLLLQGVRLLALLCGVLFAGSGQRQAAFLGTMVGAWSGVLTVLLFPSPAQSLTTIAVLGQPLLQAVLGALGGWIGSVIWKPPAPETEPESARPRKRSLLSRQKNLFVGPVAWFRVGLGVLLAVAGALTATLFFEKILDISHGALATTDDTQDRLITLEIKALALLFGGALAGAATPNGLKQGFCVALGTSVILIGIEINFLERWLPMAGLTLVGAFTLSLVGGWFGSQLFPPIVKSRRSRSLGGAPI